MKSFCLIAAIAATVSSSAVYADTSSDVKAGLLGALIGAVVSEAVNANGDAQSPTTAKQLVAPIQPVVPRRPSVNAPLFATPEEAQAREQAKADREAEAKAKDLAKADAEKAAAGRKFDGAYRPAADAYIATGNAQALNNDCFKTGDAYKCMNMAFGERVKALKEGRVEPIGCREVGLAKGYSLNGADPMKVSLEAAKAPGIFEGEVTQIEGRRLTIFNAATRQNALVSIEGAKVYGGGRIAVGAPVVGYGTHAGSVQGRLVTGAPTTIAKIAAECVGDS